MWNEMPDALEVYEAMQSMVAARARLRAASLELEIFEAQMAKLAPRNVAARKIGIDEETFERALLLNRALIEAKNELDKWEVLIDFLNFRKEMYKAEAYKVRL